MCVQDFIKIGAGVWISICPPHTNRQTNKHLCAHFYKGRLAEVPGAARVNLQPALFCKQFQKCVLQLIGFQAPRLKRGQVGMCLQNFTRIGAWVWVSISPSHTNRQTNKLLYAHFYMYRRKIDRWMYHIFCFILHNKQAKWVINFAMRLQVNRTGMLSVHLSPQTAPSVSKLESWNFAQRLLILMQKSYQEDLWRFSAE